MAFKHSVKIETTVKEIIDLCNQLGVSYYSYNQNRMIRIYNNGRNGKIIDLYPKSKKCFWNEAQDWGQVTDIKAFLTFEFKQ